MTGAKRFAALLFAAGLVGLAGSETALASIDVQPRAEIDCVRSRVVLRPEFGASLDDLRPGERMPLRQVRICSFERRTCVAHGEEVPLSQCAARRPSADALAADALTNE